jgi:photosystem II stability/assembly factor-like uncharacterized protein
LLVISLDYFPGGSTHEILIPISLPLLRFLSLFSFYCPEHRIAAGQFAQSTAASGTTNQLYSVAFIDANTGWATGEVGTILHTTDGGTIWSPQSSGVNHILTSVFFTDATTGWTAGTNGTILHTIDGGTNWEEQTSGITSRLSSVFFIDANTGWAVGQGGTIRYN